MDIPRRALQMRAREPDAAWKRDGVVMALWRARVLFCGQFLVHPGVAVGVVRSR